MRALTKEIWPILGTWGIFFALLWPFVFRETNHGLIAGWGIVWSDWAAHLAYANVFAYRSPADWLSVHPLYAGQSFNYPFLVNFISGMLMRAGLSRVGAFTLPSVAATFGLLVMGYAFLRRVLRTPGEIWCAFTLFFAGGGLGFGLQLVDYFWGTQTELLTIKWLNPVTSELLPQRAFLLGMPWTLFLLWQMDRTLSQAQGERKMALWGFLSTLLLITHVHSFIVLQIVAAVWLATEPKKIRYWVGYGAGVALPSMAYFLLVGTKLGNGFIEWYPGWYANPRENLGLSWVEFWWLNWGAFLPLAIIATWRTRLYHHPIVIAGFILFALSNLLKFQPWLWDNTKLLSYSYLFLAIPVARYLTEMVLRPALSWRCAAVMLFIFCTASGFVQLGDLVRHLGHPAVMWTAEEEDLARRFQSISQPTDIVLACDHHHHWVASLAGRQVLMGYRGWLGSYGIDYSKVEGDIRHMLSGKPGARELLDRYRVRFVVIGPREIQEYGADLDYFRWIGKRRLTAAGYEVFEIPVSQDRV